MLRNLSVSNIDSANSRTALSTYLHSFKEKPSRVAALLAIFIIPSAALGWWYYNFAMSVGATVPLSPLNDKSEIIIPESHVSADTPADTSSVSNSGNTSTNKIEATISGDPAQTQVKVNDESISVPSNGSTHQVIQNDNGKTTVDINVDSNTSGSSSSRSSTDIKFRSSSSSNINIKSKEVQ